MDGEASLLTDDLMILRILLPVRTSERLLLLQEQLGKPLLLYQLLSHFLGLESVFLHLEVDSQWVKDVTIFRALITC